MVGSKDNGNYRFTVFYHEILKQIIYTKQAKDLYFNWLPCQ